MAEVAANFGADLKDGFKPVNSWVSGGIAWIDDVQQFYRDRSAIEKEYAGKLSALAKRYFEKKAKKAINLSVGETPVVTPGSLESASMSTWTTQLNTLEQRAAEHDKFSQQLIASLADPLRHLSTRLEEMRKAHVDFAQKLEKERDGAYGDLRKIKGKYDSACQDVENKRKKSDGNQRNQVAFQQQVAEMHNVKNTYIIAINVANKQKELYYHEYVPELLNSMQDLNETRVAKLNSIWMQAAQVEAATLSRSIECLDHLCAEIPRNQPILDSMMFAQHNTAAWSEPQNLGFEPSPVWHDDDALVVDESAQNFLRNVLLKSKSHLSELRGDVEGKRRGVEDARRARQNAREGRDNRDEVDIVRSIFTLQESLHESERLKVTAEVEVSTITSVIGDVSIGARNHNFKSETFKIPTNCDHCGERIWGLSAKGFNCRDCGFTCHSKCEMKVPATCPGELNKEARKKIKVERQETAHLSGGVINGSGDVSSDGNELTRSNTMNTLSSGYSLAHRSVSGGLMSPTEETPPIPGNRPRMLAPPGINQPEEAPPPLPGPRPGEKRGKMMYAYRGDQDGEVSVGEGEEVVILEPDDGSGWMRVRHQRTAGLVPASYVEVIENMSLSVGSIQNSRRPPSEYSNSSVSLAGSVHAGQAHGSGTSHTTSTGKKKGPAVAPKKGAKKLKYVEALYEYQARSDAEHNMEEGERFVLINKDAGDGWADVEKGGVVRSVPANYVQEV